MNQRKKRAGLLRGAGILMPISSLPSRYGIGNLGREAYRFADALYEAGQRYWQVLPVGPTSFGDSPYQSFSAFAGNPYFIDPDTLAEEGLLEAEDMERYNWGEQEDAVDYGLLYEGRFALLRRACKKSRHKGTKEYREFLKKNEFWLKDYSLYMAVKDHFGGLDWPLWEADIRFREAGAVESYQRELKTETDFYCFCQFKFQQQWERLRAYVNGLGIHIIGDIPLYVAMDSADVWVHGRLFELDERKRPVNVAGVPPDAFSDTGQRWGNPLYRWDVMEQEDFLWWRERMKANARLYDIIRIDHFIGIVRYYAIPFDCPTAVGGVFRKGPGSRLTDAIEESIGAAKIIAEDLGILIPGVRRLIQKTGWPGMKILEFAFDGNPENEYLPHNYKTDNCIVYAGTHDNETLAGFLRGKKPEEREYMHRYLGIKRRAEAPAALIRAAYASTGAVAVIQMQDILGLDNKARMNTPSTVGGNWIWRMRPGQFTPEKRKELRELAETFGRIERKEEANESYHERSNRPGSGRP